MISHGDLFYIKKIKLDNMLESFMANAHRRRNNVDRIKINGAWCIEENGIRGKGLSMLLSYCCPVRGIGVLLYPGCS